MGVVDEVALFERLARIEAELLALNALLTGVLADLKDRTRSNSGRVRELELEDARRGCDVDRLGQDVKTLRQQSRVWAGINSLAATLAAAFGIGRP